MTVKNRTAVKNKRDQEFKCVFKWHEVPYTISLLIQPKVNWDKTSKAGGI